MRAFLFPTVAGTVCSALLLISCASGPARQSANDGDSTKPADDWTAPADAAARKNPLPANAQNIAAGKQVYTKQCFACHGESGKGDGPAAAALNVHVGDLTGAKVRQETDGALYWKISEGHSPMPSFSKALTPEQRWQVIIYVRSLGQR